MSDGHRMCHCGTYPKMVGTIHDKECFVKCPNCGARSVSERTPFQAWCAWDNGRLYEDANNMTIYEVME